MIGLVQSSICWKIEKQAGNEAARAGAVMQAGHVRDTSVVSRQDCTVNAVLINVVVLESAPHVCILS
jgi:hypothetical protein